MSGVAGLLNIPQAPDQAAQWSFVHQAHHRDIIRIIYERTLIALPEYRIDPMNPDDMDTWSTNHQQMHNDMNGILGLAGFNLDDVDWKDRGQLASWTALHFTEHLKVANRLQLG